MNTILRYQNADGRIFEIGPEHPDYARLLPEYRKTHPQPKTSAWKMTGVSLAVAAMGAAALWSQWLYTRYEHKVSYKMEFLGALMLTFGVALLLAAPCINHLDEETRKMRSGASQAGFIAILLALFAIASGHPRH